MAQVSRPFQIALAAVVLFAVVWFVALQGHSSSSSSTPVSTPAPATAAKAKAPAGTTHIEGMTRAVTHAREAVAASQRAADKSANSSAEAPSQGASVTSSSTTVLTKPNAAGASTAVVTKHSAAGTGTTVVTKHGAAGASTTVVTKHAGTTPAPHKVAAGRIPAQQAAVERELKRGEMAVILFWNKKGADDVVVHREVQLLATVHRVIRAHTKRPAIKRELKEFELELNKPIAVHYATAAQVASFGSITRGVQVYSTPTILIINKHGQTTTLTGLQDLFSIEQTIDEARQAQS